MKPLKQTLNKGDLVTLGKGRTLAYGIVLEVYDNPSWPAALIHMFDENRRIRVKQNLYSLEKIK